jgi:hypothetical protein
LLIAKNDQGRKWFKEWKNEWYSNSWLTLFTVVPKTQASLIRLSSLTDTNFTPPLPQSYPTANYPKPHEKCCNTQDLSYKQIPGHTTALRTQTRRITTRIPKANKTRLDSEHNCSTYPPHCMETGLCNHYCCMVNRDICKCLGCSRNPLKLRSPCSTCLSTRIVHFRSKYRQMLRIPRLRFVVELAVH